MCDTEQCSLHSIHSFSPFVCYNVAGLRQKHYSDRRYSRRSSLLAFFVIIMD